MDGDGRLEVRWSGDVLGKVVNTFVRMAPEVIDADIEYSDGTVDTLTGTPNHPFWVDAVRDYVPLGKLEPGTVLHVQGGGEAILVSKTWRQGDFEVFDFEVEGLHNFYVRGEGSDAIGVLVHNSTGGKGLADDIPELVATENGGVLVKGEDYNMVGNGTDDFLQIHGSKDHGGVGASSGIDFHTHSPELTTSPSGELSKVSRPATPTTAEDIDDMARRAASGELVPK